MNTTESNKLIAEFMGFINITPDDPDFNIYSNSQGDLIDITSAKYHESWDWFMPVVEKIESLGYIVAIISHKTEISTKEEYPNKAHCMMAPGPKLNTTYQAVIKFIERYNRNK